MIFLQKKKNSFKKVLFKKVVLTICVGAVMLVSMATLSAQKREVTVGYSSVFTDIVNEIDSRETKGYGYEIFKKIEEYSNFTFSFVPIDGSLVDAATNQTADVVGFTVKTSNREDDLIYSKMQFGKTYIALMSDDNSILYNDPKSIDGKTVATYKDNIGQVRLDAYCKRNNISVEYVYGNMTDYMHLDTDFTITYSEDKTSTKKNNVLNLGVYSLYLITSPENKELMDDIDSTFYDLVTTEGNFFWELEGKYLTKEIEINHRSLSPNEVTKLQERPLEVGYITDYNPISFTNEQGTPDGAMVETLNMLSEKYSFDVNYHPFSIYDDFSTYDDYDMLLTIYGSTTELSKMYDATETYYTLPMYAQVNLEVYKESKTITDIIYNSKKLGTLSYLFQDYDLFSENVPHLEIVRYDDWHEMLDAFDSGEVDLVLSTNGGATYGQLYLDTVDSIVTETDSSVPMKLLISKNISSTYVPIFNVMLDTVSDARYSGIINEKSHNYYPEDTFLDYLQDHWYYYAIIVIVLICSFAFYAYREQKKKRAALTKAYNTDSLTGFMSMHKFRESVENVLRTAKPNEYELISFDMDMFKTINMYYSMEKGNEVLKSIANTLKGLFDETSAYITRKTADQFLILRKLQRRGSMQTIYETAILPSIRLVIGNNYKVSMCFGNVVIDNCNEKVSTIIGYADSARSLGKKKHHTTFVTFDDKMKKMFENKIAVTLKMEQALKDKEFVVVYQPKIDFKTLKIGGAEALVRWRPKGKDQIFPDTFIPVFEENGFIFQLDMYVLEEVCKCIVANCRRMEIPRISVNLSAHSILDDNISLRIKDILLHHGVKTEEIELEVTESAIVSDENKFISKIKDLKRLGFIISLDDFGAGVSSLNRLSAIEADVLKLDKAFFDVKDLHGKTNIVVADVISMAKHLNMKVVAEGVETLAQAKWLRDIDCDYAQGYYFERPVDKEVFIDLLRQKKTYDLKTTDYSDNCFSLVS